MHKTILLWIFTLTLSGCGLRPSFTVSTTAPATEATISTQAAAPAATQTSAIVEIQPLTAALAGDISYTPGDGLPPGLLYTLGAGNGLWIVDANGKPQLLNDQYQPLLSPDGTQILYNIAYEGDIWLADLATGSKRNLTNSPDRIESGYRWWPGNPGVIIFQYQPGNEGGMSPGYLAMMRTDGSGYQVLDDQTGLMGSAAPSPDGTAIAYDRGGEPMLYDLDQGIQPLLFSEYGLTPGKTVNPAWSPDGQMLAWIVLSGYQTSENVNGVAVLNLATHQGILLHPRPIAGGGALPEATWSPDGKWLALVSFAEAGRAAPVIWMLSSDGAQEIPLGNGVAPVWSPDSRFIAFSQTPSGASSYLGDRVFLAEVGTWQPIQLSLEAGAKVVGWVRTWK
jgi:hypothetical protein